MPHTHGLRECRIPSGRRTRDEVLDDFTLHWPSNSGESSAGIYLANRGRDLIFARSSSERKEKEEKKMLRFGPRP